MLKINEKVLLNHRYIGIESDGNFKSQSLLKIIMEYLISQGSLDISDCMEALFITTNIVDNASRLIKTHETSSIYNDSTCVELSCCDNSGLMTLIPVHTIEQSVFTELLHTKKLKDLKHTNLVIIRDIMLISKSNLDEILRVFPTAIIVLCGDVNNVSPEHAHYQSRLLGNSRLVLNSDYSKDRLSEYKKLSHFIDKSKSDVVFNNPTNNPKVNMIDAQEKFKSNIPLKTIDEFLKESVCNTVVLPKHWKYIVNSEYYIRKYNRYDLEIKVGDVLYNDYPLVVKFKPKDSKSIKFCTIPALVPLTISSISDEPEITYDKNGNIRLVYLVDFDFANQYGEIFHIQRCILDYTHYLLNFDPRKHDCEYFDYIGSTIDKPTVLDQKVIYPSPFKIITPSQQKYSVHDKILCLVETIELQDSFSSDLPLYNYISLVKSFVDVIMCEKFVGVVWE